MQHLNEDGGQLSFLGDGDDDDDDDFSIDAMDILDERDVAEEERLARLVAAGPQDLPPAVEGGLGVSGILDGAPDGRRFTRAAARGKQQQQQQLGDAAVAAAAGGAGWGAGLRSRQNLGHGELQPMIPATAAGMPVTSAVPGQPAAAAVAFEGGLGLGPGMTLQPPSLLLPTGAALPLLLPMAPAASIAGGAGDGGHVQHQQQQALPAGLLCLQSQQLQQLHHQLELHAQLLLQMQAMTTRDPSPAAQQLLAGATAMLEDLLGAHERSRSSLRGQQVNAMVQQAFAAAKASAAEADVAAAAAAVVPAAAAAAVVPAAAPAGAQANSVAAMGTRRRRTSGSESAQRGGSRASVPGVVEGTAAAAAVKSEAEGLTAGPWAPAIIDLQSLYDTAVLRLVPAVREQLRKLPPLVAPLLPHLSTAQSKAAGSKVQTKEVAAGMKQVG